MIKKIHFDANDNKFPKDYNLLRDAYVLINNEDLLDKLNTRYDSDKTSILNPKQWVVKTLRELIDMNTYSDVVYDKNPNYKPYKLKIEHDGLRYVVLNEDHNTKKDVASLTNIQIDLIEDLKPFDEDESRTIIQSIATVFFNLSKVNNKSYDNYLIKGQFPLAFNSLDDFINWRFNHGENLAKLRRNNSKNISGNENKQKLLNVAYWLENKRDDLNEFTNKVFALAGCYLKDGKIKYKKLKDNKYSANSIAETEASINQAEKKINSLKNKVNNANGNASQIEALNKQINALTKLLDTDKSGLKDVLENQKQRLERLLGSGNYNASSTMSSLMARVARVNNFACTGRWFCPECGKEMKSSKHCDYCGANC